MSVELEATNFVGPNPNPDNLFVLSVNSFFEFVEILTQDIKQQPGC